MRPTSRTSIGKILPAPRLDRYRDQVFGRLAVVGYTGRKTKHGQKLLTCRCACGSIVDVMSSDLTRGVTQSCGCLHSEVVADQNRQKVWPKVSRTYLYNAWIQIKNRCYNKKSDEYHNYGGRGIKLHEPWHDFTVFARELTTAIGERPPLLSIDRIDNNRGYVPGNLRWATQREQVRNRRVTKLYTLLGEQRLLVDWAKLAGVEHETLRSRLRGGWTLDEALGTPPGSGRMPAGLRRRWTDQKK